MLAKIREAFVAEAAKDESQFNLAGTALLMSGYLKQTSEVTAYLTLLDEMAQVAKPTIKAASTDLEIIDAVICLSR